MELEPELVTFGAGNLAPTDRPWASIRLATPGRARRPRRCAVRPDPGLRRCRDALPDALVDQLADDGVLVIPVAGTMLRVANPGAVVTEHGRYRFVPLR